jgi:hypothetical protein
MPGSNGLDEGEEKAHSSYRSHRPLLRPALSVRRIQYARSTITAARIMACAPCHGDKVRAPKLFRSDHHAEKGPALTWFCCKASARTASDHYEFDWTIFRGSSSKSVASHPFDCRPICEKVLLRLHLRRELGLQNAALARVAIRYLKGYCLRSFANLLLGRLWKFSHAGPFKRRAGRE